MTTTPPTTKTCPTCGRPMEGEVDPTWSSTFIFIDGKLITLTPAERRILEVLLRKINRTVTKEEVLDWLYWDRPNPPFNKILDVHMCKLRAKLPNKDLIMTVWGVGYCLMGTIRHKKETGTVIINSIKQEEEKETA